MTPHRWQLAGHGPEGYERYLVPAFFAGCAGQLLDLAAVGTGERVLDVACGTGIVARMAAGLAGPTGTVAGTDLNAGMLEVAAAQAAGIGWQQADATSLPFPDASFDVACCQQGLQFFADRPGALAELHRVVAPGGRIALAVWRQLDQNLVFAQLVAELEEHAGPAAAGVMRAPFAGPDRDELRELVLGAGFEQVRCRIGIVTARFPSTAEFLRVEVLSTPLVGTLDQVRRDALVGRLEQDLASYVDDDGITFGVQTWLLVAQRPSA